MILVVTTHKKVTKTLIFFIKLEEHVWNTTYLLSFLYIQKYAKVTQINEITFLCTLEWEEIIKFHMDMLITFHNIDLYKFFIFIFILKIHTFDMWLLRTRLILHYIILFRVISLLTRGPTWHRIVNRSNNTIAVCLFFSN